MSAMTDKRVWDEDIERCAMRLYALSVTRVKNGLSPLATGPTPLSTIISWEELPQRDKDAWRTTAEKVIGPECRPLARQLSAQPRTELGPDQRRPCEGQGDAMNELEQEAAGAVSWGRFHQLWGLAKEREDYLRVKTGLVLAAAWALTLFGHVLLGLALSSAAAIVLLATHSGTRGLESALDHTVGALSRALLRARRAEGWCAELLEAIATAADNTEMSTDPTKSSVDDGIEQAHLLGRQIDLMLATRRGSEVRHG